MSLVDDRHTLPPGLRIYAVGDVHGRADLLDALHARIAADVRAHPPEGQVRLVYLGDYVDRGPDSRGVIDRLIGPPPVAGWERIFLRGNHEAMMMEALSHDGAVGLWMLNGGRETTDSYLERAGRRSRGDPWEDIAWLRQILPAPHEDFLAGLALSHRAGDLMFVHAGLRPGLPLEAQRAEELLWIRQPFLACTEDLGALVVHGHTITAEPEIRPNRIGIDTGAFATGVLTAVVLEGSTRRFLRTAGSRRP